MIKYNKTIAKKFTNTLRKHDDYIFFNNLEILFYLRKIIIHQD